MWALDGRNSGFLRPDAALAIVFFSDEDDSSCVPYVDAPPCLAAPSCRCDDAPTWGSVEQFERFFLGLKGYGNEGSVRVGAIVATDGNVLSSSDAANTIFLGCTDDPSRLCGGDRDPGAGAACAFRGQRYLALAERSGGLVADICSDDPGASMARLGSIAAGLRTEFRLNRRPFPDTIDVLVVPDDAKVCNDVVPCDPSYSCVRQKCVRRVQGGLPEGWEHVICSGGTIRNVVRFGGSAIPEPLHTIEVCYDVDVRADAMCQ
jgi:hypothetical protein